MSDPIMSPPLQDGFRAETLAAQALGLVDPTTGAFPPAISLGVSYARTDDYQRRTGDFAYSRDDGNPVFRHAESLMTALEVGAAESLIYCSGMAAGTAAFQVLKPGDRVVVPEVMYFGLTRWLQEFGMAQGLIIERVPTGNLEAIRQAVEKGNTKLVWVESPCNPTWLVTDIQAVAAIAHAAGAKLGVDNTVATPVLTNPLRLGADIVLHSATKYLNGHSDVYAGFLVTAQRDEYWNRIKLHRRLAGAIPGPLESYLLIRGMRTLYPRMRQICETAMRIARHFQAHPEVSRVAYCGLASDPGHAVAARQMNGGFSGMMSLHIKGPWQRSLEVAKHCKLLIRATSLGAIETLIEHRYTFEGPGSLSPKDMLRISIGLEHPDDIITDLEQAIKHSNVPAQVTSGMNS
jgi:cystathionine gamma-synthase